ncbi:helix-turn-helix domain-containing protein [Polynucleobacter antarcticus]|uniref:XRE family transcriptional regulator n=1 Tax=Polynucleobacter antarcticus TaxID=1743162 RepID=A0A6M9Q2M9_9BURK|nr:helix-turn-helix transcriptional regulator [Polynucleobacter antarcticus]QKM62573.1 XRE family transcriptional regulator [Polynucleobacter antarcticus]
MAKPFPRHEDHSELKALGETIRALRLKKDISQEALAVDAGIDRSYMGGIERGEHNLAMVNLIKVADALGVSLKDLMGKARL